MGELLDIMFAGTVLLVAALPKVPLIDAWYPSPPDALSPLRLAPWSHSPHWFDDHEVLIISVVL